MDGWTRTALSFIQGALGLVEEHECTSLSLPEVSDLCPGASQISSAVVMDLSHPVINYE